MCFTHTERLLSFGSPSSTFYAFCGQTGVFKVQCSKETQLESASHICRLADQAKGEERKGSLSTFISHLKRKSLKQGNKYSNDFAPWSNHIKLMIGRVWRSMKRKPCCFLSARGVAINTVGEYSLLSMYACNSTSRCVQVGK